ncbi:hypothetical protein BS329_34710 [Amycolatopsis coloradensis]|uniref:Uncharacterized protein n=1 Tax=Amycolatopsis coloradensis TaxID=76021 RepID=A0A1R0KGX3_9PSEU|nr:hypothetical protein [Amycolatopsis coloradensis]OLZ44916.1 hypothetical protein BS329_34710 [Amycolatopsis coloradensis]
MHTSPPDSALLGIYLNDHLAGAIAETELAKRVAGAERDRDPSGVLDKLAQEIADDRAALLTVMAALGVPVRRYKAIAAWAVEKAARLKPNGRLVSRSPLSRVVEFEALRLGVEGKAAGWRTLRVRADSDPRIDAGRLDNLIKRARRQIDEIEEFRAQAAAEAFGGDAQPAKPSDVGGEPVRP